MVRSTSEMGSQEADLPTWTGAVDEIRLGHRPETVVETITFVGTHGQVESFRGFLGAKGRISSVRVSVGGRVVVGPAPR